MKNLYLDELIICDLKARKARKVRLRETTVIIGPNDTGKSSLLKSLLWPFGAELTFHDLWKQAAPVTYVRFRIDDEVYGLLRYRGIFYLELDGQIQQRFESIGKELGPFLAQHLDFGLLLQSREGLPVVPPPSFIFLPFYIDQDKSWTQSWNSFEKLAQFADWKSETVDYFSGTKPNKYQRANARDIILSTSIDDGEQDLEAFSNLKQLLLSQFPAPSFNFNIADFHLELERLTAESQKLLTIQQRHKEAIAALNYQQSLIQNKIAVLQHAHHELKRDLEFAANELPAQVTCPTCHAPYSNGVLQQFEIAEDAISIRSFLLDLETELREIIGKIETKTREYYSTAESVTEVKSLLEKKQETITFAEIVTQQCRSVTAGILNANEEKLSLSLAAQRSELKQVKTLLKGLSPERRKPEVLERYQELFRSFLSSLSVETISPKVFDKIAVNPREFGSDQPRSLLAYQYVVLHLIWEFSDAPRCPIIIDSPDQQDQDGDNLRRMFSLIFNERPPKSQLVLAATNVLGDTPSDAEVIELSEKYSVLEESQFEDCWATIEPLLQQLQ